MNCILISISLLNPPAVKHSNNRIQIVSGMKLRLIVRDEERSRLLSGAPEWNICQAKSNFYFDSSCTHRLRGFCYSFIYSFWFTSSSEQSSLFLDPPNEKQ